MPWWDEVPRQLERWRLGWGWMGARAAGAVACAVEGSCSTMARGREDVMCES